MLTLRKGSERGRTEISWLDSRHSFSFGEYHDPGHMGFRRLRVINEDFIAGGGGFGTHPHRDMEILTYVVEGGLTHRDSLGNGSTIAPGRLQRMTAGRGIAHSEFNASKTERVHLLQIWIEPERRGLPPGYEEREIELDASTERPLAIATPDGRDGSLTVHQDVVVYAGRPKAGGRHGAAIAAGRGVWIQLVRGEATAEGGAALPRGAENAGASAGATRLQAGDAVAFEGESAWSLVAETDAEYLAFDLG